MNSSNTFENCKSDEVGIIRAAESFSELKCAGKALYVRKKASQHVYVIDGEGKPR